MKHLNKNLIVASLLIPGILIMGIQKAYAATGALSLNNFQVPIGSTTLVPVTVNVTDGFIGGFAITITYDESVVDVTSNANIILNPTFNGTVVADAGVGTSTIQATTTSPSTGNITLANVRFSGVGASGSTGTITVTPQAGSFVDETATVFAPEPVPVSATVTLVDTTPDPFSIPNQINVPLSSPVDSAPITITGIDVPTSISVTGGEYSINSGPFTATAGTVVANDIVVVRLVSSASYSTATNAFLRVGLGGDDFQVTTIGDPAIDIIPDGFSFVNQINVPLSTAVDSNAITVLGINAASPITVTGGEYSINGNPFTADPGTVNLNDTVVVRLMSSAAFSTQSVGVLRIGGVGGASDDFRITTIAEDSTPDTFTFTDQTDVALSTPVTSAPITVAGITVPAAISIVGGEYEINGSGTFTADPGTVANGNTVAVRLTSSASFSTPTDATLTIGGVNDVFTATTLADPTDVTPDAFTFVDQVDVALASPITSAPITVAGINAPSPISVVGGEYEINGSGTFTADPGTIENGNTVVVRHTSSASFATPTDTVLTIGGVSDTFTSTTLVEDTTPEAFTFVDQTDVALSTQVISAPFTIAGINSPAAISIVGGEYEINGSGTFTADPGTVANGNTVAVRLTSSAIFSTPTTATLTVGGVSDEFSVTTVAEDTTPEAFTFVDQADVALSSQISSAPITVTGINSPTAISIVGGEYEINGSGTFTADPGTVANGNTVAVRLTSSASFSTPTSATLTIGGVSDQFTATTLADVTDIIPDQFTFTDLTDVAVNTLVSSAPITVTGIGAPSPISIVGGEYSVNGGAFTADAGTVETGNTVIVRHTSSTEFSTAIDTILSIGGVSDTFTTTTVAAPDTIPDAFTFADQTDVAVSTIVTSAPITVAGINVPSPISIVGGEYEINGSGTFTTNPGNVENGNTVVVRLTSSASFSTPTSATLTIGGVSDEFTATTLVADTTPEPFVFADQNDVAINTAISSFPIIITGINAPAPISIVGGEYEINGSGTFTSAPGAVSVNDTVIVRLQSSASYSTTTGATLTVGGVSDEFSVMTMQDPNDSTPDPFSFTDQADVARSTNIESAPVTITGINVPVLVAITGGEYSINGGAFVSADGTIENGNTIAVRLLSSAAFSTTTSATVTIDGVSDDFSVTTASASSNTPVLQSIGNKSVLVNASVTFTAQASDPNGDTLTFSLGTNAPVGATINPSTGVFAWTPTAAETFTFDVIVSDGALTDSETITITVSDSPQIIEPPVVALASANNDSCGDTCEKYKELRRKYRNDEARSIYRTLKDMKQSDPATFSELESIYRSYRDLSDREIKMLDPKIQSQFKLFKSYAGYKHYKNLKERVD